MTNKYGLAGLSFKATYKKDSDDIVLSNNEQIRVLIKANNLTYKQAAAISGFSWTTIRSWVVDSSSDMARNTPKTSLELFKLKLDAHLQGKG